MKVIKFTPISGYIVTKKTDTEVKTTSGFETQENADDLLVFAEVILSSVPEYKPFDFVVFHDLCAQEFRDGKNSYLLVHEDDIVGTYTP